MRIFFFLLYYRKLTLACCFILTVVFAALYIFQVNALVAMAYSIAGQETQIFELKEKTRVLQANVGKALSLRDFERLAAELHFEKVRGVTYLKLLDGAVAQSENRE